MNASGIVQETRALAGEGDGQAARAWALSWRVVRFLERAEETARHNRIESLNPRTAAPLGDPVKFLAALCIKQAVPAPTMGEAATVAALARAVDLARTAADSLYRVHVARHPKAPAEVLNDPRRLAALRRTQAISIGNADEFLAADAAAEAAELAAEAARKQRRRDHVENIVQAGIAERKTARRLVRKGEA